MAEADANMTTSDPNPPAAEATPSPPAQAVPYLPFGLLVGLGAVGLIVIAIVITIATLIPSPVQPSGQPSTGVAGGHSHGGVLPVTGSGTPAPGVLSQSDPSAAPVDTTNAPAFPLEKRGAQPLEPTIVD